MVPQQVKVTSQNFGNADSPNWVVPVIVRRNGIVDGTEFRSNYNSGLTVQGDNARVVRAYTHHNGRYGINVTFSSPSTR